MENSKIFKVNPEKTTNLLSSLSQLMHGTDFDKLDYIKSCARKIAKFGSPTRKVVRLFLIDNSPPLKCNQSYQIRQNKTRNKTKPHQKSLLGHSLPYCRLHAVFFISNAAKMRLVLIFSIFRVVAYFRCLAPQKVIVIA